MTTGYVCPECCVQGGHDSSCYYSLESTAPDRESTTDRRIINRSRQEAAST